MNIKVTPRRLPKSVDQEKVFQQFNRRKYQQLILSALLDGSSFITDAVPAFGQAGSVVSAVIYGIALFAIYRSRKVLAMIAGVTGVLAEVVSGLDIVPVAFIVWCYAYVISNTKSLEYFFAEKRKHFDYLNNHYL